MFGVFFSFIKKDTCLNKCQIYFKIKKIILPDMDCRRMYSDSMLHPDIRMSSCTF